MFADLIQTFSSVKAEFTLTMYHYWIFTGCKLGTLVCQVLSACNYLIFETFESKSDLLFDL